MLDFGRDCQQSLELLYQRAYAKGLLGSIPVLDFVAPQRIEVIEQIESFIGVEHKLTESL